MNLEDIENVWKDNDKRIEDSVQVKTEYMKALQIHYALKKYESILKATQVGTMFLYIMLLSLFFMAGYFTNNLLTFSIISIGIVSSIIILAKYPPVKPISFKSYSTEEIRNGLIEQGENIYSFSLWDNILIALLFLGFFYGVYSTVNLYINATYLACVYGAIYIIFIIFHFLLKEKYINKKKKEWENLTNEITV
jgi:hypothetical protein